MFLGREIFDEKTRTYRFRDGTGIIPEEMEIDVMMACDKRNAMGFNGIYVLGTLFAWKDRIAKISVEIIK